ncbi:hypothetical protein glysoja_040751 [Glycine soja]|uniref:Uncharacterized protein n=1 Tax=Glycine soja TaxID=3848 RepID=A0A0B2RH18_GLYSO|nr:hypothetical protein glysoja_040751 [Glycine soja]
MPLKCSIKGKPFRKPDISVTVQEVLEKARSEVKDEFFLSTSVPMSAWHPSSLPLWGFGACVQEFAKDL